MMEEVYVESDPSIKALMSLSSSPGEASAAKGLGKTEHKEHDLSLMERIAELLVMCLDFSYGGNFHEQKVQQLAPKSLHGVLWEPTMTPTRLQAVEEYAQEGLCQSASLNRVRPSSWL